MKYFTLNEDGHPIHEPDYDRWEAWFESADRSVARSIIGDSQVSTQFEAYSDQEVDGLPALWETVVMGGFLDGVKDRCGGSREQAETMHAKMVERVKTHEAKH